MQAAFYRDFSGVEPVSTFIDDLAPTVRATLDLQIN
jgi:hypothetical protein